MANFQLTICFVLAVVVSAAEGKGNSPWFCHSIECPTFKTLEGSNRKYEIRAYPKTRWVTTVVKVDTIRDFRKAEDDAFLRLFRYISGENEGKVKIAMTAPVLEKITVGQGPFCANGLALSFYVPEKFQANPPKPTSKDVFFTTYEPATYYVRGYSTLPPGATAERIISEAGKLVSDLSKGNITDFNPETYFRAGYDPPFRLIGRHDEIWLKKSQKRASPVGPVQK